MTSRPRDAVPPEQIIAATWRRILAEPGPIHPDLAAGQVLADLAGHRYELIHRPPAPDPCVLHPNTALNALGHCPICGPKGL